VVFDPFLGSGTVGKVCERLGRRWAGLDLSADYLSIARNRTRQLGFKWADGQMDLFK
jgi:site-specific DNA-methyltransferase (cytosine-N4-specific)